MTSKLLAGIFLLMLVACAVQSNPWGLFRAPSPGPARAIGSYANGCLAGARVLPLDGVGYQVMRPSRGRFYGHPMLIRYIEALGKEMARAKELLLVGDMAQARGGPMDGGHASHQVGLEVDLWYLHPFGRVSDEQREELSADTLVSEDGQGVDPAHWDVSVARLLRLAASQPAVDRIFVNPAIKKELCRRAEDRAWLHKIRPWWGHADHFHVRLQCPTGEAECVPQTALTAGDGCDATLDWWFTAEARTARDQPHETGMPAAMPLQCRGLVESP